jgi:hypothetical protein
MRTKLQAAKTASGTIKVHYCQGRKPWTKVKRIRKTGATCTVQYLYQPSKETEPRARGNTERRDLNWSAGNNLAAYHDVGLESLQTIS